jgi:3-deoxy-7-phosphoheptulonate synthase
VRGSTSTEPDVRRAAAPSPAAHQPDWPDRAALDGVLRWLRAAPGLVTPADCDRLRSGLAEVAAGRAFLLQGGDCAETFESNTAASITARLDTLHEVAGIMRGATGRPTVTVGRIAGQYAKPRSHPTETRDGVTLPAYRGDAVNGASFHPDARRPDPDRMRRAYQESAVTLLAMRAFPGRSGGEIAGGADRSPIFSSHEGLLLDYERTLRRIDDRTGLGYATSGHLLWIGERTRALDGPHVAFFASVANPIAVKIGPDAAADDVLALIDRLDPERRPGRLTLITRMGARLVADRLPPLVAKVAAAGARVGWVCDPMHGNTIRAATGHKTRRVADVLAEIRTWFAVHRAVGTHPGGLHLELTGAAVTECLGGPDRVSPADLPRRYETVCDPRLNRVQAVDLIRQVAELAT